MNAKGLRVDGTIKNKVRILSTIQFGGISDSELLVLSIIIYHSTNNSIALSSDMARQIKKEANITDSSFSTSLYRLKKQGLIRRDSKTITIHPIFSKLDDMERLVISFNSI
jgi:DNA-binding MarR family transcriptional regulator